MAECSLPGASRADDRVTGVVLAGGRSSRFGQDKTKLCLAEEEKDLTLVSRTVSLLRVVCDDVVVVGQKLDGYTCFLDLEPGNGPVGGIATALACVQNACLVLSCDMPFMEEAVLERLVLAHQKRPDFALCTSYRQHGAGRIEALAAIYEAGCLPYFQECVSKRLLKISLVVPHHMQHYLWYGSKDALAFFNINYPEDLELARRVLQTEPWRFARRSALG